ncbi:MAG: helicase-exonuclease AddAB subunit AddB [Lachnospiraceae bacterium]|nr:helicase-exonuclease AddAB subunit AddB [Lachnospiraceae bacterium]
MALQLIFGGCGAGKTSYVQDKIIQDSLENPNQLYFILVPEQFTMQTQKDLVVRHPNHGTMNIDVVSFQRLAYRVFEELAVKNLKVLDDMGKSMVLRKVAANKRKELILFQGHLNQTGFVNQLKSMLSEFYQYGISPQILRDMAEIVKTPLFRQKLKDFAVVYEGFQEYIAGHYITTEEVLDVLCRVLPQSETVKNSIMVLDGFTGFTPVQYRLLELCLVYAKNVAVTVTADETAPVYEGMGMQNLFFMTSQMVRRLTALAEKNQVKKEEDLWVEREYIKQADRKKNKSPGALRFLESPELGWLERNLFRYRRGHYEGEKKGGIELFQGMNPYEEIAHVADRIQAMVQEEGLRYREFAVVTGDLAGYGKEIAHQFQQNQIPFFMDDKKNVLDNPVVELIRGALEAVHRDFSYESVFRYLRSGLVTANREMTDRMENYVIALGIRGHKRWEESWERTYREAAGLNLKELNDFKEMVITPLLGLREAFAQKSILVAGRVEAVMGFLDACCAREKLEAYQEYFTAVGEYRLAKEYGQVYDRVVELLARLSELLGEEQVGRKEFMEILDAGFGEISVGVIPATVDRVVVGDITRTRLAHVKVLFFVGVNDGIVPMKKDGGSLLSDQEREFFGRHKLELAPTAREDSFRQRFYLYLMMTKPSKKLVVSYALTGRDGKSKRPSYLIGELGKMFPDILVEEEKKDGLETIYTLAKARKQLTAGLRRYRDMPDGRMDGGEESRETDETKPEGTGNEETLQFLELFRWFLHSKEHGEEAKRLAEAAFTRYERQGLGHAVARALYGNILSGSVTRLEQYAACAYAHFLQYGLELVQRRRYELAAADMGNLFHSSIDLCFRRMREEGRDWRTISDTERSGLVHSCVEQVTAEYGNTIMGSSARNAYLAKRVEHITQRTVWALQQQIKKGDFSPAGFEVSFSAADNLEAMKIPLSADEALHLRGRIDRLDLCEDGQQVYVKIIDYKSGSTRFDLAAIYYGLQLQLVVYMDAVMEMTQRNFPDKEVIPAGILYYNISDPLVEREGQPDEKAVNEEILRKLRMNGLINSELEAVRHLDHTIETQSDIIPVVLKNGEVEKGRSSVANRERFDQLRKYVHKKVKDAGQEILDGEVGVEPYKSGPKTACDYCPYHSVCGFDKKISGYDYRRLKGKRAEEIWEELCR